MLSDAIIESILQRAPSLCIGVLGDLFLDRYLEIDESLNEPSLETGLTAFQVVGIRSQAGAAGTVINNLASLGVGRIFPIAIIGDDGEGFELRRALAALPAVDPNCVISLGGRRTPTYTKPILRSRGGPVRELNRLDIKNRDRTPPDAEKAILHSLDTLWLALDALIVVDQVSEEDCGVVTGPARQRLAALAERDRNKFVLADSRERIQLFRHVCIKPNEREGQNLFQLAVQSGRCAF